MNNKQKYAVYVLVTFLLLVIIGTTAMLYRAVSKYPEIVKQQEDGSISSRRTVILADGEVLTSIDGKNLSMSNGELTVKPYELMSSITIGAAGIRNTAGTLELSNAASTWHKYLALPYTTYTSYAIGQGQTSGTTELTFGDTAALRYNHTSSKVEYYDAAWLEVGSGSGGGGVYYEKASGGLSPTAAEIKGGVVVELHTADGQTITLPDSGDFSAGETGTITVFTRSAVSFIIETSETDLITVATRTEEGGTVETTSSVAFNLIEFILTSPSTTGWLAVSGQSAGVLGFDNFSVVPFEGGRDNH